MLNIVSRLRLFDKSRIAWHYTEFFVWIVRAIPKFAVIQYDDVIGFWYVQLVTIFL